MFAAELRWPPHPYRAGFGITDDTDCATLASVRSVYDVLAGHGVRTTKTVWAFPPEEPCGIPGLPPSIQRGETLADPEYLRYCESLAERGFEITLHGATAGNNRRETTARAFALLDDHFPTASTYICHAKNADNPYWQEKTIARGPLRRLLGLYAGGHRCSGEDPGSPYFWGDLCMQRVRYIRLLRTRDLNTLAANPSMPYFEREKPLVRGWFSASKRSFRDATEPAALDRLESEWGLTVLYQYLCRYADPSGSGVKPEFAVGVARLAARERIWADTTTRLLDRLRLVQGVFLAAGGRDLWVVNTNDEPARDLQIECAAPLAPGPPAGVSAQGGIVRAACVEPGSMLCVRFERDVSARGPRGLALGPRGAGRASFGHGEVFVNTGEHTWRAEAELEIAPRSFRLRFEPGLEWLRPMSCAPEAELTRLFLEQSSIILREYLFKGRAVDSNRWLGSKEILLEDHDRW